MLVLTAAGLLHLLLLPPLLCCSMLLPRPGLSAGFRRDGDRAPPAAEPCLDPGDVLVAAAAAAEVPLDADVDAAVMLPPLPLGGLSAPVSTVRDAYVPVLRRDGLEASGPCAAAAPLLLLLLPTVASNCRCCCC